MKLVTRYILRELAPPFLVSLLLFIALMLMERLLDLTELIINQGVSLTGIVLVVLMRIPETFQITVPMALVIAVMMTYGRLMADHEITALRAAGYPLHGLMLPPLVVGLVLSLGLLGLHQYGLPQLAYYQQVQLQRMQRVNPLGLMRPRTYLTIEPYTLYAQRVDGARMENVYLEDRSGDRTQIIYSQKGTWFRTESGNFGLRLENGTSHQQGEEGRYRVLNFEQQVVQFRPRRTASLETEVDRPTLLELYQEYSQKKQRLYPRSSSGELKAYRRTATRFFQMTAVPFASFFLLLTTAPLSMWIKRIGRVVNFVLAMGLIFVYFLVASSGEAFAEMGWLPPFLSLWSANLLFGITGMTLYGLLVRKGG